MNYLAHQYLSGSDDGCKIGNFIADHVKGSRWKEFDLAIRKGIWLHRQIDFFTDNHPLVRQGTKRISSVLGKFSGVAVDMYFDHFLAANWSRYSAVPLEEYTTESYLLMVRNYAVLPEDTRVILPFIIKNDWMASYRDLNFLDGAMKGLAKRIKLPSSLDVAVKVLIDHYELFRMDFLLFFEELRNFALNHRNNFPST
jgi:acyl carrier protein phosphodiesterase